MAARRSPTKEMKTTLDLLTYNSRGEAFERERIKSHPRRKQLSPDFLIRPFTSLTSPTILPPRRSPRCQTHRQERIRNLPVIGRDQTRAPAPQRNAGAGEDRCASRGICSRD